MVKLTFGRLAKPGIPDRTVVYYFPSKAARTEAVLHRGFEEFRAVLGAAFDAPADSPEQLVGRAWTVVTSEPSDRLFRLFFDALGASMHDPALAMLAGLMEAWVQFLQPLLPGAEESDRRAVAEAAVALLDGLLVLRHESADRAARRLL